MRSISLSQNHETSPLTLWQIGLNSTYCVQARLDLLVLHGSLELLGFLHLSGSLHEVILGDKVPFGPNGKQPGLSADISEIGSIEPVGELDNRFIVNVL